MLRIIPNHDRFTNRCSHSELQLIEYTLLLIAGSVLRRTCNFIGKSDPKLQNFFKKFECGKQAICIQIIKYSLFNKTSEGKVINSAL